MSQQASSGGIGFGGLLTVLFIGLKLTNVISWSWIWVLSPLWIPISVFLGIIIAVGIVWLFVVIVAAVASAVIK